MQSNTTPRRQGIAALLALSLASALAAVPAAAQDAARKAQQPAKSAPKAKVNVMSRDELRACMNEQDRLQGVRAQVEQEQTALDRSKAEVGAMDAEIRKKIASLDAADEPARKALQEEGVRRDQAADAYNARVAALREQVQTFDTARQAWVERCTTRSFDEMDEAAIRKERAQAARASKK